MSNVKSDEQMINKVPPVDAEESLDKYTEDFGGYSNIDDGVNAS